ncbi:MAG: hypothetical protein GXP49_00985 [Deltaproteobacteria bacterium]|nr:hypothetical protein [Deltaproteobacteria bacterium]
MRIFGSLKLGVILLVSLMGCDSSISPENPYDPDLPKSQQEPGALVGVVVPEATIDITGAKVRVQPGGKTGIPDSKGRFRIDGLAPGVHEVSIEAPHHLKWQRGGIYVPTGEVVNLGEVRLVGARGGLSGHVVLEKRPNQVLDSRSGVTISIKPVAPGQDALQAGYNTTTERNGSWSIEGLLEGSYVVRAAYSGFLDSDAVRVDIVGGEIRAVQDLLLRSVTGVIEINKGDDFVNQDNVTLRVLLASNKDQMQVSNQPDLSDAEWQDFKAEIEWSLSGDDGEKTVYARFRNSDGYVTPVVYDSIVLDRKPPTGPAVTIADGAEFVRNPQVSLQLDATDDLSGVAEMRYSLDKNISDEPWVDFERQKVIELKLKEGETPDGIKKTVQAQFRDRAGNESEVVEDSVVLDSVAPTDAVLQIQSGATLTSDRNVTLTLSAKGATRMMISADAGFIGADWTLFAPSLDWTLGRGDGVKTLHAKFADNAGNETSPISANITLDTTAPGSPSITVMGGDYTSGPTVDLKLSATGDPVEMAVWETSATGPDQMKWLSYSTKLTGVSVSAGDGLKTFAAVFKDSAGNISAMAQDTVILDTNPPRGTVSIAEGRFVTVPEITLVINSADAARVCIVDGAPGPGDCVQQGDWQDYAGSIAHVLPGSEGEHAVFVKLKDRAGNESDYLEASAVLDLSPPYNGSIEVTGTVFDLAGSPVDDTTLTALSEVQLKIEASDSGSGVAEVMISNDPSFSGATWRPYTETPMVLDGWSLGAGSINGEERTVYAKFRDKAGRENSTPVSSTIILDNVAPSSPSIVVEGGADYTTTRTVEVQLNAVGATYAMYSVDPAFDGAAWIVAPWSNDTLDLPIEEGEHLVYAKFRDDAGNESAVASDTVILDASDPLPPTGLAAPGRLDPDGDNYVANLTPTVSWTPSASSDVDHYVVVLDSKEYKAGSVSFTAPALEEGSHTWSVRAVDKAGRESAAATGNDFVVDVTPPTTPGFENVARTVVGLGFPNRFPESGTLNLAVISTDHNLAGYQIRGGHDGVGVPLTDWNDQGMNTGYVFYLLDDAMNTLMVRAVDKAGNVSGSDFVNIYEDSTPPLPPRNIYVTQGQGQVKVEWDKSPSDDVAGYNLYYGTTPGLPNGDFADQGGSPVFVGNTVQAGLTGLPNATPMYISLSAVDRIGQESARTLEVAAVPNVVTPETDGVVGGTARDLGIFGNIGLLATGLGLRLVDLSDISNLQTLSEVLLPGGAFQAVPYTNAGRSYAVVAGGEAGLQIVDITDPGNPFRVSASPVRASAEELLVIDDYAYVRDSNIDITIFDISDPLDPVQVGVYFFDAGESAGPMAYKEPVLFVGDTALDLSTPDNPISLGTAGGVNQGPRALRNNNELFVANKGGLQLEKWDVTDPLNPVKVASRSLNAVPQDVMVSGSLVVIARGDLGLKVFDPDHDLAAIGGMVTSGFAAGLTGNQGKAFLVDRSAGLMPLDLSDPDSFVDIAGNGLEEFVGVAGVPGQSRLAVLNPGGGLKLYDTTTGNLADDYGAWAGTGILATGLAVGENCIAGNMQNELVAAPVSEPSKRAFTALAPFAEARDGIAVTHAIDASNSNSYEFVALRRSGGVYAVILNSGDCTIWPGSHATAVGGVEAGNKGVSIIRAVGLDASGWGMPVVYLAYTGLGNDYVSIRVVSVQNGVVGVRSFRAITPLPGVTDFKFFKWSGCVRNSQHLCLAISHLYGYNIYDFDDFGVPFSLAQKSLPAVHSIHVDADAEKVYLGCDNSIEVRNLSTGNLLKSAPSVMGEHSFGDGSNVVLVSEAPYQFMTFGGKLNGGPGFAGSGIGFDLYVKAEYDNGLLYLLDELRGLRIVDVSDPANPKELGGIDLGEDHRGLDVAGPWAAVLVDRELKLVDVSTPTSPAETDLRYNYAFNTAKDVKIHSGWVYVASPSYGRVYAHKIGANGKLGSTKDTDYNYFVTGGDTYSLDLFGNNMLVARGNGDLELWDVSDPLTPASLDTESIPGLNDPLALPQSVSLDRIRYFVAGDDAGLTCGQWTSLDLGNPAQRSSFGKVKDVLAIGDQMLVAEAERGLRVWDSSGLNTISGDTVTLGELGYKDTPGVATAVSQEGTSAFLVDGEGGVRIMQLADVTTPRKLLSKERCAFDLEVDKATLYTLGCDKLEQFMLYNFGITNSVGWPHNNPAGLAVRDGFGYIGDGTHALTSFSYADLLQVNECSDCVPAAGPVETWGDYAVTVAGGDTLEIVDTADPAALASAGTASLSVSSPKNALAIAGGRAVVVNDPMGLQVFDLTRSGPVARGTVVLDGTPSGVSMTPGYAYVASGWAGLTVVDIMDPYKPSVAQTVATQGFARSVEVHGRYAFVAQGTSMSIFDVSDPALPAPISSFDAGTEVYSLTVQGTYVYLALGEAGIEVVDLR